MAGFEVIIYGRFWVIAEVLMGVIWILQGLNLAWGSLSRSFMRGDQHWVFYGAVMLIVGVCQVVWSNTRQRE
jgi:hypothetical protein